MEEKALQEVKSDEIKAFEDKQRIAKAFQSSSIVPESYKKNLSDCMIAMEMAVRLNANPVAVMQNLYIVHGKPSWSSQFLISCVNASGKFAPLRYKMTGKKGEDSFGCIAWAKDQNEEILEGPEVTIGIAKAEGWYNRQGSKWKNLSDLMLRYRAATFFARLYCPELTMGISTVAELHDIRHETTETKKLSDI